MPKFCKDCQHFVKEFAFSGGALLPEFAYFFPAQCFGAKRVPIVNLIDGTSHKPFDDCKDVRADAEKCGPDGAWFEPATLDGRLAMLPKDD
jgi:hypothetical protein